MILGANVACWQLSCLVEGSLEFRMCQQRPPSQPSPYHRCGTGGRRGRDRSCMAVVIIRVLVEGNMRTCVGLLIRAIIAGVVSHVLHEMALL